MGVFCPGVQTQRLALLAPVERINGGYLLPVMIVHATIISTGIVASARNGGIVQMEGNSPSKGTPMNDLPLTSDQVLELLEMYSDNPPTENEVHKALESLVQKELLEVLWDEDGKASYRLTEFGLMLIDAIKEQENNDES